MLRDRFGTFYLNSGMMLNLFEVEDTELNLINTEIDNAYNEFFIDTAINTLDQWEAEYGLPKSTLPVDQRRATIKAKKRGYGTVTATHIKTICDAYTNGNVNVTEKPSTYEFEIKFNSFVGIPPNIDDLKNVIEQIKPAHLGVTYVYLFTTYQVLSGFSHQQLSVHTHDQLRNEAII